MKYTAKSFTVPLGSREPTKCEHGFTDQRGCCVFCGATPQQVAAYFSQQEHR